SGNSICLATAPQLFRAFRTLPSVSSPFQANDIAILPGGGSNGADALVFVGSSGLHKWTPGGGDEPLDVTANWVGATFVRVAQLDGTSANAIVGVGVTQNGQVLLVRQGTTTSTIPLSGGETVEAFATLQWDDTPGAEIAIVTNGGLRIFSPFSSNPLLSMT